MTAKPAGKKRRNSILMVLLLGNLLGFVTGEVVVRALGDTDEDGNFWWGGTILGPRHPQVIRFTSLLDEFEARPDEAMYVYDAELGWNLRPGATSENGLYYIDERGIRTGAQATPPRKGPIIALYGGSVTFCSEVPHEESWGHQLEQLLAENGRVHQVMNLGVGGYDMGQAYLRWRSTHAELGPEIVVFGLYPGNIETNISIIRQFSWPNTKLPFSKPRYVLEGDELGVVNLPSLAPRDVLEVLRDPRGWALLPWEASYVEAERQTRLWQYSRLLSLLFDDVSRRGLRERQRALYREDSQAFQIAVRIIQRFHDEVQAAGSLFMIVPLLSPRDLARMRDGEPIRGAAMLAELERRGMTLVDPTPELLGLAEREGFAELYEPYEHFSPSSNRVIAEVLARSL
jgi:hypothetical protein